MSTLISPSRFSLSVHRGPDHALDAVGHQVSERQVVGGSVARQQDLHFHLRREVQALQEEGVQGSHGGRLRLRHRLLTGNEVKISSDRIPIHLCATVGLVHY